MGRDEFIDRLLALDDWQIELDDKDRRALAAIIEENTGEELRASGTTDGSMFVSLKQQMATQIVSSSLRGYTTKQVLFLRRLHHFNAAESSVIQYVDMDQAALIAKKSKRQIRRWFDAGLLPKPDIEGKGGTAHQWEWARLRPALEERTCRQLPEKFPSFLE